MLIPGSGLQLTNISHVRDLSSMLTLAVENPDAASHGIFNIVSDRAVTLNGIAKLCAQAAGRPVNIVHYDPKAIGIDAKKAFPFRNMVLTSILCSNLHYNRAAYNAEYAYRCISDVSSEGILCHGHFSSFKYVTLMVLLILLLNNLYELCMYGAALLC